MASSSLESRLRGALWSIASATYLGAFVELVLSSHYEQWRQWMAFVTVAVGLAAVVWAWRAPSPRSVRTAALVSAAVAGVSLLGVGFHLWGNAQFSLEVDPGGRLAERVWDTLTGGNPAFAPGMLAIAAASAWAATWGAGRSFDTASTEGGGLDSSPNRR